MKTLSESWNYPMISRRRASLKDVAALAKTSVATASRVLNNTGYTAEETRKRVLKSAESLSYQPNLRARGLRQRSSRTIGLLIPNLLNAYYTALADAISQLLTEHGYQLLLSSTRDDPQVEENTLHTLIGHDVDGLLWVPTAGDDQRLDFLQSQRLPAIAIVRRVEGNRIDTIVFEDFAGSKAGTQHLIDLGHKRIGYIGGDVKYSSNHERWQGHLQALQDAGISAEEPLIKLGALHSTWGAQATGELLKLVNPPTAIFVSSNVIMPGVMKTISQSGVSIPKELSLICFDDLDWFAYSNPPISAIATSHTRIAEEAVNLLLGRIENAREQEKPPVFKRINFELVIRNSTIAYGQNNNLKYYAAIK